MNLKKQIATWWGLIFAVLALITILVIPFADVVSNGETLVLSVAGQRMLAILVFAVIVWISEVVSYELSAIMIIVLIAFLLGFAPDADNPGSLYGTSKALGVALKGFSSRGLALVAEALFISAAMTITGLDKRIALHTLGLIGTSAKAVLLGVILVTLVLSLLVPSATARCACMVPIMMGVIEAFKVDKRSKFAAGIMICVAQATNIWNVGILTAAAQNVQTVDFISAQIGVEVPWLTWFVAGAPWAVVMSIILFFLVRKILPPEQENIAGGKEVVSSRLRELGPMKREEKTLLAVSVVMLFCWSLGGLPNPVNIVRNFSITDNEALLPSIIKIDTTTVTAIGLLILLLPKYGVMEWRRLQKLTSWGTLFVFAVGISLGGALITSQAGTWMAGLLVSSLGLNEMSLFAVFGVLALFLIVIHLGFASSTAISGAMIPIMIPVAMSLTGGDADQSMGIVMLLGFSISFGMILPINSPQGMLCMGTETFTPGQFSKVGVFLTIIGYALLLLFAKFYWPLLGLI